MHFSFVSIITIFGKSDHLTLPQRQQRRPKLGEYFKHLFLVQKMSFFHIFFIFLVGFSNCNWLQSISELQKPPSRPFLIENWSKKTKVMAFKGSVVPFPKKNACFRKFEILPKILPDFKGSPRTLCVEGMVLLTKNH